MKRKRIWGYCGCWKCEEEKAAWRAYRAEQLIIEQSLREARERRAEERKVKREAERREDGARLIGARERHDNHMQARQWLDVLHSNFPTNRFYVLDVAVCEALDEDANIYASGGGYQYSRKGKTYNTLNYYNCPDDCDAWDMCEACEEIAKVTRWLETGTRGRGMMSDIYGDGKFSWQKKKEIIPLGKISE